MLSTESCLEFWKPFVRGLDPRPTMTHEEIEALYVQRPRRCADDLAQSLLLQLPLTPDIELQGAGAGFILCGSRGSGKTTELTRLGYLLHQKYCVLQLDLHTVLPENSGALPIIVLIGAAGLKALQQWNDTASYDKHLARLQEALNPSRKGRSGPDDRLDLATILDAASAFIIALPFPEAQLTGLAVKATGLIARHTTQRGSISIVRQAQRLKDLWRGQAGGLLEGADVEQARGVMDTVNDILAAVEQASGRPPLVLADGLDKRNDLESLVHVLETPGILEALAVPAVYTGPVNLQHDPRFNGLRTRYQTQIVYNIPVHNQKTGSADDAGISILTEALRRRLHHLELPEDILSPGQVQLLAYHSGGAIRDFLEMASLACKQALGRDVREVSDDDVENAIREFRHALEFPLNEERLRLLRRVLNTAGMPGDPVANELLFLNYIFCYPDGDLWFRPHQCLVGFILESTGGSRRRG